MRVQALAVLSTALFGCAAGQSPDAETVPSDVLVADEEKNDPGAMFRHCTAVHRDGETDDVTCAGYHLEVRKRVETSFEPILDGYIQTNVYARTERSAEYETKISQYQLEVRKDKWPGRGFRLEPKMTGGTAEVGYIVVGEGAGGQTISVTCNGKEVADRDANLEADCKAAMTYILMSGVPKRLFEAE